jgi:hypothetical protein
LIYEDASYHSKVGTEKKSRAPTDPKTALENSIVINPKRRLSYDPDTGEIVIFGRHLPNTFHGSVRTWNDLDPSVRNALIREFNFTPNGKPPKNTR